MSDVVEAVDIEVNIVVSETAKKAIDEVNKELEKITKPGDQAGLGDIGATIDEALDSAVDNAKESADKIIHELDRITEAGKKAVDAQSVWEDDGGGGAIKSTPAAPIEEAGKAAETILDRLDRKVQQVADTIVENFGDSTGGIAGFFGRWAESARDKFSEITESGRQAADLLRETFGDNIFSDFIDGAVTAAEKAIEFGKNTQKLGDSVSKWAPKAGQVFTKVGGAVAAVVPIVVGAAGQILGAVTAFAAAFALPITAVVATVGALGYAWYSAGQESKKALEEMAKADEKIRILQLRAIDKRDREIDAEGEERSKRTGFDIEDALASAGVGNFEEAFEKIESSLDRIAKRREEIKSTLTQEGQVIGSEVGQAAEKLNLLENEKRAYDTILQITRQKFELEQQGLQVQRDKVKSQLDEVRAAQEILRQQEQSRLSLQERLGRLEAAGKLSEFEEKYAAFKSGGDLGAGIEAESILGGRIEGVGKAAAASVDDRFSTDFLDELGPKIEARNQELLDKVSQAAGGLGQKAIDTLIKSLQDKDTDLANAMQDAADKAAEEMSKVEDIIATLMQKIRAATLKLEELQYRSANSASGV